MSTTENPILVWTMGKVGSSSIAKSLRHAGFDCRHLHTLRPEMLEMHRKRHIAKGLDLRAHFMEHTQAAIESIPHWRTEGVRIVTLVREPLERNVSAYFHNLALLAPELSDEDVAGHVEKFLEVYPHGVPLRWIDEELSRALGFDFYALPFDRSARYSYYEIDRLQICVMRTDAEDEQKSAALERLVDEWVPILASNVSSKKSYASIYKRVREAVAMPKPLIERAYNSRYVQHFWTPEEIAGFRAKWGAE